MDIFQNIFGNGAFTIEQFILCIFSASVCGIVIAFFYIFRIERYSHSFIITIAIIPPIVAVVLLVVGDNIGAGIAVAGAFSLIKFRSAPGTAKEIGFIFLAMSAGLLAGAGYLGYSIVFTASIGLVYTIYNSINLGLDHREQCNRLLNITIPEDLDYIGVFDNILEKYTTSYRLSRVKTTNMGTMFRLTYEITTKNSGSEKKMMDEIRCKNGNLEVSISDSKSNNVEL